MKFLKSALFSLLGVVVGIIFNLIHVIFIGDDMNLALLLLTLALSVFIFIETLRKDGKPHLKTIALSSFWSYIAFAVTALLIGLIMPGILETIGASIVAILAFVSAVNNEGAAPKWLHQSKQKKQEDTPKVG